MRTGVNRKRRRPSRRCGGCGKRTGLQRFVMKYRAGTWRMLCAEHAGLPVAHMIMAVPKSGPVLFWDGRKGWTPRHHRAEVYRSLDAAKLVGRGLRLPGKGCDLAYYRPEPSGPKDWKPKGGK